MTAFCIDALSAVRRLGGEVTQGARRQPAARLLSLELLRLDILQSEAQR
jgi:hypothetical protein